MDLGFQQHIEFLSCITMVNEIPELYLKAGVPTVDILHAKGKSSSNSINEIIGLLPYSSLRYIDVLK